MSVRNKNDAATPALAKGKAATINDIARLSGVSKKTVSRIINNSPLVRKDTRDKVEALMREVGYMPDPLARGLAFRRSFLIGMVYVLLPFVVLAVGNALARVDPACEQASADLGASPAATFFHITWPLTLPGVV
ncbi:hypothetical protein G6F32_014125 [Rhizopus arrhizus]|nr:hypothetical protein G6F32_014125 [Rhizopus arrhizus]